MATPDDLYDLEKAAGPLTVCVTGGTGFLAAAVIKRLLSAGHTVRTTVRDTSNTDRFQHLLDLPGARERLQVFAADLIKPGSFEEAVGGCDHVIHTASPNIAGVPAGKEHELLINPALKGTENVLDAVNKSPSVKRVVLTSSCLAVYGTAVEKGAGHEFTEQDWNITATTTVQTYSHSKVLAERRAWELAKEQNRWQLVVLLPSIIYGPTVSPRNEGESMDFMIKMLNGGMWPAAPPMGGGWVDIRDAAAAHCLAMLHPDAKGRYICSEGCSTILDRTNQIKALFPGKYRLPSCTAPAWLITSIAPLLGMNRATARSLMHGTPRLDNSKIQRELGFMFTPVETTLRDMVLRMAELGFAKKP